MTRSVRPSRFDPWILLAIAFLVAVLGLAKFGISADKVPSPQLTVPCEVTEVYDGDTVTVKVTLLLRVRLLDCWAPEIKTRDAHEKQLGLASRDALRDLVFCDQFRNDAGTANAVLSIPIADMDRLDDAITLGRVLGDIYLEGDQHSLSTWQRSMGHAYRTKDELQSALTPSP